MLKVAKADLKKSSITPDEAEYAEMYSVKDASTVYDDFKECPALVIPYIDPWTDDFIMFERSGEQLPFHRVRYYEETTESKGFSKSKKQLRYSQPKDSGVHPYFPVVEDTDWVEIAEDTSVPIMITEGEKKALCACLAGIPTIGLGGVYNFSQDGELLPMLDLIEWSGRPVYICYDSDAADNSKIQVAEGRLATELSMKRNASVFLVRIPERPGGAKIGIDDYTAEHGDDALHDLLASAPEMRKLDREVLRLNASVAYIEKEGMLLDLDMDNWIKKSDFTSGSRFSTGKITVATPSGKATKEISIAQSWLTHEHARRYADTIFRPGNPDKAIPLETGGVAYNRFRGLREVPGDVAPFFDLYDHIMSRTDEFAHDLIWKTVAYKVQNWEENIGLGFVLLGKQGGGKTLFCEIMGKMVTPYNKVMADYEMGYDFNGWIETSLVVVMNETESNQLQWNMARLKTYITDATQPCNEKYRANRQVESYALYFFNSNERSAGAFAGDDRRMIVLGCPDTHPDGDLFYGPIFAWRDSGGPKKLLYHFMNFDLQGWKPPRHAPDTREKRMAYHASLTPVQKLGDMLMNSKSNVIGKWIAASIEWATSPEVGLGYQAALAAEIASTMMVMRVRPFYTPDELALMFPSIAGTLQTGKVGAAAPSNELARQLLQLGIEYLRCKDNYDGFYHKGHIRQFLIIADWHKFTKPITQEEFDDLMDNFPTYKEWRALRRLAAKKRKRKS